MIKHTALLSFYVFSLFATARLHAQQAVSLMNPEAPTMGWSFGNGPEFPGAKGGLVVDELEKHNGQPSLKFTGDFINGGQYVQMTTPIEGQDIRELSFWVKGLESSHFTIRVVDSNRRTHQIRLKAKVSKDWQQIVFPLESYFANQGTSAGAGTPIVKYESWGGRKDEQSWKGPAQLLAILQGRQKKQGEGSYTIWVNNVTLIPRSSDPVTAESPEVAGVPTTLRLDEVIEGEHFWKFTNGPEFKGAEGSLTLLPDQPEAGDTAIKLNGDFTAGGAYVGMSLPLVEYGMKDLTAIHLRYKSENLNRITIRLKDGSGQAHQRKNIKVVSDGNWHELTLRPEEIAGGEHWGGAKDEKWQGAPQLMFIGLGKPKNNDQAVSLTLGHIQAEAMMPGSSGEATWNTGFEDASAFKTQWSTEGTVSLESEQTFKGAGALVLRKTEATLRDPVSALGPVFPVTPGRYEIKFAVRTDLDSMDNSYRGSLSLELLSAEGNSIERIDIVEPWSKNRWKAGSKQIDVPADAVSARFTARIHKETTGLFALDDLSAARMQVNHTDDRIQRLMFTASELGHLLFPDSSREIALEVWANKPLPAAQRVVHCEVRDYWGAEQAVSIPVTLSRSDNHKNPFIYTGTLDLSAVPLEIGRYYEIHGRIELAHGDPFTNYSSFAILPEAPANAYPPEQVPFTSRNWDNRVESYVRLTHRLGIRICGIWGRYKAEPPYLSSAPQLKVVEELGMGWLTSTPAQNIERRREGYEKYTEENLRAGMRKFLNDYSHVRPLIVNLGNEPHNKGEEIAVDVEAYRILYTEIKKFDPTITIVGTSVGPEEGYFAAGMGEWLDAYDFHTYADLRLVRNSLEKVYPALFEKYGHAKPIWSTEVGLNSQGMDRQQVAGTLYKKFVNFFAGGGASISWFGLLYPDPQGKNADTFGSAHNVFDCRYNKYAPKLDAIAYYNAVNAISVKKYIEDRTYGEDIHAFLFQDEEGNAMQLWYTAKSRQDLFIPLPDVANVQIINIDGRRNELHAESKGITLTVNSDPVVLLYAGGPKRLSEELGPPAIRLSDAPERVVRGEKTRFVVELVNADANQIHLSPPPFWRSTSLIMPSNEGLAKLAFEIIPPEQSAVRAADISVMLAGEKGLPNGILSFRPDVTGTVSIEVLPVVAADGASPAVRFAVHNNSPLRQRVTWNIQLLGEQRLQNAKFTDVGPTDTFFQDAQSGSLEMEGHQSFDTVLPLADADLYKVYRIRASVRDAANRVMVIERPVAAFYPVPKTVAAPDLDGQLDEEAWQTAPVRHLDHPNQFFAFPKPEHVQTWEGPQDLSAELRYLWDDENLYLGITVTDDKTGILQKDDKLWFQDGLQLLIDPVRTQNRKVGKYDIAIGVGEKGPQAWCHLSADADTPSGIMPDVIIGTQSAADKTASRVYEVAIPWKSLAPFHPAPGANLGFTLIVNEDDGKNRDSFMTWFGNAHNKDVDVVGDLILMP